MSAHQRLADLLADLVEHGFTDDRMDVVRALPALVVPPFDADPRAARHYTAWTLTVQPYRSALLSRDGLLHADPATDHLATHLRALAPDLLDWLPPVVLAVRSANLPEHTALVELIYALACNLPHRPGVPDPVADPLTDDARLRDLAVALAVPARTGAVLTGPAIDALAAAADVPSGFGARRDRIEHALRSAADLGRTGPLVDALDAWLAARAAEYAALGGPVDPWIARVGATRAWVSRLRSQVP